MRLLDGLKVEGGGEEEEAGGKGGRGRRKKAPPAAVAKKNAAAGGNGDGDERAEKAGAFVRFELDYDQLVVLDVAAARAANESILRQHSIAVDRSPDLLAGSEDEGEGEEEKGEEKAAGAAGAAAAAAGSKKRRAAGAAASTAAAGKTAANEAPKKQKQQQREDRRRRRRNDFFSFVVFLQSLLCYSSFNSPETKTKSTQSNSPLRFLLLPLRATPAASERTPRR